MTRFFILFLIGAISVLGLQKSWAGAEDLPTIEDNVEDWKREKSAVFLAACRSSNVHMQLLVIRAGANEGSFFVVQDGLLSSGKHAVTDAANIELRDGQWRITDASGGVATQRGIFKSIDAMLRLSFRFLSATELDQVSAARPDRPCP